MEQVLCKKMVKTCKNVTLQERQALLKAAINSGGDLAAAADTVAAMGAARGVSSTRKELHEAVGVLWKRWKYNTQVKPTDGGSQCSLLPLPMPLEVPSEEPVQVVDLVETVEVVIQSQGIFFP